MSARLTLLGTGNAMGVPVHGCACSACVAARTDATRVRGPTSAVLEADDGVVLLDAGFTDLHQRFPRERLLGVVLTHFHPDHVLGLFHLRWGVGPMLPVWCPQDHEGCADLYKHPGSLAFTVLAPFVTVELAGWTITPLPLAHSKPTFGYAIARENVRAAYLTDTTGLPPKTAAFLHDWQPEVMVIDCSFPPGSTLTGHNDLPQALELIEAAGATRGVLTHIGHDLQRWLDEHAHTLPAHIAIGCDGLDTSVLSG